MAEGNKAEFNRSVAEIILLAYFIGGGETPQASHAVVAGIVDILEEIAKKQRSAA